MLSRFHCVRLYAMLWTAACQIPPSMGFSRQECRSGLLFPPPGDLPDPGVESASLVSSALAGGFFTTNTGNTLPQPGKPWIVSGKALKLGVKTMTILAYRKILEFSRIF